MVHFQSDFVGQYCVLIVEYFWYHSMPGDYFIVGITEEVQEDVEWCLQTPQLEKIMRVSVKRLFAFLNPLEENVMTRERFLENIGQLPIADREKHLLEKAGTYLREI